MQADSCLTSQRGRNHGDHIRAGKRAINQLGAGTLQADSRLRVSGAGTLQPW
jgi:hypothetical protein